MFAAEWSKRVEFRATTEVASLPFGCDPAALLQFVQRWVERPVANLQHVTRNLFQPLADGPAMQGLEAQNLQNQKVQRSLDKVSGFAHYITLGYRGQVYTLPVPAATLIRGLPVGDRLWTHRHPPPSPGVSVHLDVQTGSSPM